MSCSATYNATKGLSLLGDELGAWMADTTAETLVGSDLKPDDSSQSGTITGVSSPWYTTDAVGQYSISGGVITAAVSVFEGIRMNCGLTIGEPYIYKINVLTRSSGTLNLYTGGTVSKSISTTGELMATGVADASILRIASSNFNGTFTLDIVRLAIPDLSTANNGLGVHGSIIKSAVATGAELVAYSGFSTANYLEQPYNADLNRGSTDDFYFSGWANLASLASHSCFMDRADTDGSNRVLGVYVTGTDVIRFYIEDGAAGTSAVDTPAGLLSVDTDYLISFVRSNSGTTLSIYINGQLVKTGTVTARDVTSSDSTATLRFGVYYSGSNHFSGSLALWRSGGSVTAAQIKAIYDKEKILFNEYAMYTQEGESYILAIAPQGYNPSSNHVRNKSTSLSGVQEVIYLRHDRFWDITTGYTLDTAFDPTRRFIDSVSEGQTFTLAPPDPFVDTHQVVLDSDSYQESRVESSRYFTASFRVKAAP